jgi:hypothetical protein
MGQVKQTHRLERRLILTKSIGSFCILRKNLLDIIRPDQDKLEIIQGVDSKILVIELVSGGAGIKL